MGLGEAKRSFGSEIIIEERYPADEEERALL
jgi:hypothetical protein